MCLEVASKTGEVPEAKIVLSVDGREQHAESQGSGPVDATFKAIESIASSTANLQLYSVNAITQGTDSQGEVTVRLEKPGASSTAMVPTPTSWWRRPRPISTPLT